MSLTIQSAPFAHTPKDHYNWDDKRHAISVCKMKWWIWTYTEQKKNYIDQCITVHLSPLNWLLFSFYFSFFCIVFGLFCEFAKCIFVAQSTPHLLNKMHIFSQWQEIANGKWYTNTHTRVYLAKKNCSFHTMTWNNTNNRRI